VKELLAAAVSSFDGVELAVLFGSAARGSVRAGSDIDVAVKLEPDSMELRRQVEVTLARAAGREERLRKTARTSSRLDDAEGLVSQPLKAFASDVKSRDLSCFYLFLAIQECIDPRVGLLKLAPGPSQSGLHPLLERFVHHPVAVAEV
jgi:predicted nucleotidyltransferase